MRCRTCFYAEHRHAPLIVLQGMDTPAGRHHPPRLQRSRSAGRGRSAARRPVRSRARLSVRIHRQEAGPRRDRHLQSQPLRDVLITRVHQWIDRAECKRRYDQIDFERMLAENGTTILKFFLHISKERWHGSTSRPSAGSSIRATWKSARSGARTCKPTRTPLPPPRRRAPWYVIPSDSKSTRNLLVSSILIETLAGLHMAYPKPEQDYSKVVIT